MSKILTTFSTKWATFSTIAYPGQVSSMIDLYDFRVLMSNETTKTAVDIYFQVTIHRKVVKEDTHVREMLSCLYGQIFSHLRSKQFIEQYGKLVLREPRPGKMNEERRINIELDRLFVREPVQMTFIGDTSSQQNEEGRSSLGDVMVVVRLPRGFTVKLLPVTYTKGEIAQGTVWLLGRLFYFYIHRPPMTEPSVINMHVLSREFEDKLSQTFSFLAEEVLDPNKLDGKLRFWDEKTKDKNKRASNLLSPVNQQEGVV